MEAPPTITYPSAANLVKIYQLIFNRELETEVYDHTPLTIAIAKRDLNMIDFLLSAKVDVNHCPLGGLSPLMMAIYTHQDEVAKRLIAAGANVNFQRGGVSPLSAACRTRNFEMFKELRLQGAQPNPEINWEYIQAFVLSR